MTNLEAIKAMDAECLAESLAKAIYSNAVILANNAPKENVYEEYKSSIEKWLSDEFNQTINFNFLTSVLNMQ